MTEHYPSFRKDSCFVYHYFLSKERNPDAPLLPPLQPLSERGSVRHRGTGRSPPGNTAFGTGGTLPSSVPDKGGGYGENEDVKKENYNTSIYIVYQTIIRIIFNIKQFNVSAINVVIAMVLIYKRIILDLISNSR